MGSYDTNYLCALYKASVDAEGSAARGKTLEDLVEYVFTELPSVRLFKRDVPDGSGAQEVDLIFSHFQHYSDIPIQDVTILVECKNERKKTSSPQIYTLMAKLRSRSLGIGLLVTAAGISGTRNNAAHAAIRDAMNQGVAIIVVIAKELAAMQSHNDLGNLLLDRLMELRTYREYRTI
ncbi:hypothetical protein FK535_17530 [Mycolicibacterium sp. 018/SC-01/001]|uniref:restriction endonuclease n=1 Tax=Mycolicibacterium sp. 018/SC-01/001 TaxID=2592069 RepID=UPI00118085A8|nr:restriction endonuclease [Mycolicibacterium sp. 018/SC-01/001]TRW81255.1 hypothetical protein FK535_17530 [Mycolicibacterium sp. 018/SC-01/001]